MGRPSQHRRPGHIRRHAGFPYTHAFGNTNNYTVAHAYCFRYTNGISITYSDSHQHIQCHTYIYRLCHTNGISITYSHGYQHIQSNTYCHGYRYGYSDSHQHGQYHTYIYRLCHTNGISDTYSDIHSRPAAWWWRRRRRWRRAVRPDGGRGGQNQILQHRQRRHCR